MDIPSILFTVWCLGNELARKTYVKTEIRNSEYDPLSLIFDRFDGFLFQRALEEEPLTEDLENFFYIKP